MAALWVLLSFISEELCKALVLQLPPEVEAGVEGSVALFLVEPSEGVLWKAVLHEAVQVTVPVDLDANHPPLWWAGDNTSTPLLKAHHISQMCTKHAAIKIL